MTEQQLAEIIQDELESKGRALVTFPRQDVYCSMKDPIQLQIHMHGLVFRVHIERE